MNGGPNLIWNGFERNGADNREIIGKRKNFVNHSVAVEVKIIQFLINMDNDNSLPAQSMRTKIRNLIFEFVVKSILQVSSTIVRS